VEQVPEDSLATVYAALVACKECLASAVAGMEDGAVEAGLPRDMARSFVRQTAVATALLLQDYTGSPADLKDQVASPGGTTIAGLAVLEDFGVRGAFIRAIEAAVRRAHEERDEERPRMVE
jgi:pyrroline-5-carboxylate reductase